MLEDGDWDWYTESTAPRRSKSRHISQLQQERRGTGGGLGESLGEHQQPSEPVAGTLPPSRFRPMVLNRWKTVLVWLLLLLGLVTELVLAWVGYYLVDLSLDLMEVWVQLARKHLEITL